MIYSADSLTLNAKRAKQLLFRSPLERIDLRFRRPRAALPLTPNRDSATRQYPVSCRGCADDYSVKLLTTGLHKEFGTLGTIKQTAYPIGLDG